MVEGRVPKGTRGGPVVDRAALTYLRTQRGLSQRRLGLLADVPAQTLGQWERGRNTKVQVDLLAAVAAALDVDLRTLIDEPPDTGLADLRYRVGFTQTQVAELLGVNGSTINRAEVGERLGSTAEQALAGLYNTTPAAIRDAFRVSRQRELAAAHAAQQSRP